MKATIWLRTLSVLLGLFALGHTLGTFSPKVTRGNQEAQVFSAMQGFRFHVMGFDRTYWDFYRGLAITVSALLIMMSVMAWQAGAMALNAPEQARPIAISLFFGCASLFVLGCQFFFAVPVVMSGAAVVIAAAGVAALQSQVRRSSAP